MSGEIERAAMVRLPYDGGPDERHYQEAMLYPRVEAVHVAPKAAYPEEGKLQGFP